MMRTRGQGIYYIKTIKYLATKGLHTLNLGISHCYMNQIANMGTSLAPTEPPNLWPTKQNADGKRHNCTYNSHIVRTINALLAIFRRDNI